MAKKNLLWDAEISYRVSGCPPVTFRGRTPFSVTDIYHRAVLLGLGVFSVKEDGRLFYSAPIKFIDSTGNPCWVGEDGIVEYDMDSPHSRYIGGDGKSELGKELIDP